MSSTFSFLQLATTVFLCVVTVTVSQGSVCFWNRNSDTNSFATLNGLYEYAGELNGAPYYANALPSDCGPPDTFYLYKLNNGGFYSGWFISPSPGNLTIYARCADADSVTPSDCGTNSWILGSDTTADPNSYVIDGDCPQWDCASISTTLGGGSNLCAGPFDTQVASNVWSRQVAGNTYYFYYHEIYQTWRCSDNYSPTCGAQYYGRSEAGWQSLSSGQSTVLNWPSIFGSAQDATITCTGSGSGSSSTSTTTTSTTAATTSSSTSTSSSSSTSNGVSMTPTTAVNTPTIANLPTVPSQTTSTVFGGGSVPTAAPSGCCAWSIYLNVIVYVCASFWL